MRISQLTEMMKFLVPKGPQQQKSSLDYFALPHPQRTGIRTDLGLIETLQTPSQSHNRHIVLHPIHR